ANLKFATLTDTNFSKANLTQVKFQFAQGDGTNFSGADTSGADFGGLIGLAVFTNRIDDTVSVGNANNLVLDPLGANFLAVALGAPNPLRPSATYTALGGTPATQYNNLQALQAGDKVTLQANYDTPTFTVGAPGQLTVNLQNGNVVEDGTTLYRYFGPPRNNFSLTDGNI